MAVSVTASTVFALVSAVSMVELLSGSFCCFSSDWRVAPWNGNRDGFVQLKCAGFPIV